MYIAVVFFSLFLNESNYSEKKKNQRYGYRCLTVVVWVFDLSFCGWLELGTLMDGRWVLCYGDGYMEMRKGLGLGFGDEDIYDTELVWG